LTAISGFCYNNKAYGVRKKGKRARGQKGKKESKKVRIKGFALICCHARKISTMVIGQGAT
jgi:hypothetical protein